ncbi:hypothetical protein LshimejAT787_0406610 [Lyophyllum shimeji]|uniref:Uncharacterized protein n=1 Tax=Lyophyllum shimeji TaxID=47721 RepID=A0A9P3PKJ7_LYOSH|nr:hypothetical protein LshimejAT787_0406610 [Lyophyllum shimeji]
MVVMVAGVAAVGTAETEVMVGIAMSTMIPAQTMMAEMAATVEILVGVEMVGTVVMAEMAEMAETVETVAMAGTVEILVGVQMVGTVVMGEMAETAETAAMVATTTTISTHCQQALAEREEMAVMQVTTGTEATVVLARTAMNDIIIIHGQTATAIVVEIMRMNATKLTATIVSTRGQNTLQEMAGMAGMVAKGAMAVEVVMAAIAAAEEMVTNDTTAIHVRVIIEVIAMAKGTLMDTITIATHCQNTAAAMAAGMEVMEVTVVIKTKRTMQAGAVAEMVVVAATVATVATVLEDPMENITTRMTMWGVVDVGETEEMEGTGAMGETAVMEGTVASVVGIIALWTGMGVRVALVGAEVVVMIGAALVAKVAKVQRVRIVDHLNLAIMAGLVAQGVSVERGTTGAMNQESRAFQVIPAVLRKVEE